MILEAALDSLKDANGQMTAEAEALDRQGPVDVRAVLDSLVPMVSEMLVSNWEASGLKAEPKNSKGLKELLGRSIRLWIRGRNLVIGLRSGLDDQFYKIFNALDKGGIRGKHAGSLGRLTRRKIRAGKLAYRMTHAFGYFTLNASQLQTVFAEMEAELVAR